MTERGGIYYKPKSLVLVIPEINMKYMAHITIFIVGLSSFCNTDLSSDSSFKSIFLPIIDFIFMVYVLVLLVLFMHSRGMNYNSSDVIESSKVIGKIPNENHTEIDD